MNISKTALATFAAFAISSAMYGQDFTTAASSCTPTINFIRSVDGGSSGKVAPLERLTLTGSCLAPGYATSSAGRLPTNLNTVAVVFTLQGGFTAYAPIQYVSPSQIAVINPLPAETGTVLVTVSVGVNESVKSSNTLTLAATKTDLHIFVRSVSGGINTPDGATLSGAIECGSPLLPCAIDPNSDTNNFAMYGSGFGLMDDPSVIAGQKQVSYGNGRYPESVNKFSVSIDTPGAATVFVQSGGYVIPLDGTYQEMAMYVKLPQSLIPGLHVIHFTSDAGGELKVPIFTTRGGTFAVKPHGQPVTADVSNEGALQNALRRNEVEQ